jgi:hypothetical protein
VELAEKKTVKQQTKPLWGSCQEKRLDAGYAKPDDPEAISRSGRHG